MHESKHLAIRKLEISSSAKYELLEYLIKILKAFLFEIKILKPSFNNLHALHAKAHMHMK